MLKKYTSIISKQYKFEIIRAGWEIIDLYNNQINARALIGQSAVGYCYYKPTEKNRACSELLYKSIRPQVSMVYRLINHLGCW